MSSGGQNGTALSGVTSMRLQNASDVTARKQFQLTYQTYASTTGANAFMGDLVNATGAYLQFRAGRKEQTDPLVGNSTCVACSNALGQGLPYGLNPTSGYPWTFRNRT
jgi:hypothetical protein